MTDKMTRKMHVPAYEPALLGVQADEYSGVPVELKNTMSIIDMGMREPLDDDDDDDELEW
jgi:hypothetical protein